MAESIKVKQKQMQLVEVKLLFFARAREIVGEKELKRKLAPKMRLNEIYEFIFNKEFPMLLPIRHSCVLAINREYQHSNNEMDEKIFNLHDGIEIAIIPPLSGG